MTSTASYRSFLGVLLSSSLLLAPAAGAQEATPPATEAAPPSEPSAPVTPSAPTSEAAPAEPPKEKEKEEKKEKDKPWYERLRLRGYTQVRHNGLPSFRENPELVNDQGDRFIGDNNNFGIRRARLVISGDIGDHVSIYIQPDFASVIGDQYNVAILRDLYADIFLDKKKEFRFRVGQSKVPFGFENLQSSQNRLPLDRNDALNSALRDERDLGVFGYWAPAEIRERFKFLVDSGLKGSGDYGVVGVGIYNGQNANRPERNNNLHVVGRVAWPFLFGKQFVEVNVAAYYGKYNVTVTPRDGAPYALAGENDLVDARAAFSLVIYPQPIGFVAEYNFGKGPSLGEAEDNEQYIIDSRRLRGGYAQVMLKLDDVVGEALVPYVRGTIYEGGKKFETNAPRYDVKELELGVEWQIIKALELTLAYDISDRTSSRYPYEQERGDLTRVQLQFNY
ncbi:porin [Pyxidicoccus fallax]|uniref:Porin n=1 Tax=Pyxidicoccus fallax TaxID=394095 RepID=A0A848LQ81_9BACT|nr:porin [Pyxidicoccus fallax]NMO19800.1 porin [Pyxidicoccus fallax]NPC84192.1 porin [Pyxidicoccus fallax]